MANILLTMDKKQHFSSIPYGAESYRYSAKEKSAKDFVKYGEQNNFPNHLVDLFNNSSIHETCVNAIVEAIKGDGLTAEPTFVLDRANSKESWNDLYSKIALDYYLFGGFSLEIIYNKLRTKISEVYHIPFAQVRAKEANYRGEVDGYFLSRDWDKQKHQMDANSCVYLPAFDWEKRGENASQIYYHKPYHPNQEYYPLPAYVGALKVIELDTKVDNWHVSNISNGLTPSIAITTYTNGTDEDVRTIEQSLRANLSSETNAGQMIYMDVASRDEKPDIDIIAQNGGDDYYTTINDMVVQKILTAHRIVSPMLVGIRVEGTLGGRNEMLDAYTLFLNMVIKPFQQDLLKCIEYIIEKQYPDIDVTLGVEQKQILDVGEMEVDVITSRDAEAGEDVSLENDIEEVEQQIIEE